MAQTGWLVSGVLEYPPTSNEDQKLDFFENVGSNVDFGTFTSPRTMYIIPWGAPQVNMYYVLSAANFTISGGTPGATSTIEIGSESTLNGVSRTFTQGDVGVTLPDEIYSVTIKDMQSPDTVGNILEATINFKPEFTVTGNHTINIDFDGFATLSDLTEPTDIGIIDDSAPGANSGGSVEVSDPEDIG
jgi:hypothetical protein